MTDRSLTKDFHLLVPKREISNRIEEDAEKDTERIKSLLFDKCNNSRTGKIWIRTEYPNYTQEGFNIVKANLTKWAKLNNYGISVYIDDSYEKISIRMWVKDIGLGIKSFNKYLILVFWIILGLGGLIVPILLAYYVSGEYLTILFPMIILVGSISHHHFIEEPKKGIIDNE